MEEEKFKNATQEPSASDHRDFTEEEIQIALNVVQKLLQWERDAKARIDATRNNATIELERQTD